MSTNKPDDKMSKGQENNPSYQLPKTSLKIPMPPVKQYNFQNAKLGGGFAGRDYKENITNNYSDFNLQESLEEIKQLIDKLSKDNPINTTTDAMKIATQVIEKIETNPTWKQRVITACQKGLLETLKNNPIGAFVAGAIEGWKA
ncbi:MAG: hypothetical protein AB4060_00520 [Crocosphaera sp.]